MNDKLDSELLSKLNEFSKKYGATKVLLFGSRARGDNRINSDIDIAVFGMPVDMQPVFLSMLEDLPTLLKIDCVFVSDNTDKALLNNIFKDGVLIMSKYLQKLENLKSAVKRLYEAVEDYETAPLSSVRDGVIQRFEFCTELAWKTVREYLIDEGFTDINSPKSVMKIAFEDGIIDDGDGWNDILTSRNITSHIYDDLTAHRIFEKISSRFLSLFNDLILKLEQNN